MMINETKLKFWNDEGNKITISQSKLIKFLETKGFARVKLADNNHENVRLNNNRMKIVTREEITDFLKHFLLKIANREDVFEVFARGIGQYINDQKLSLLNKIELIDDRDPKNKATFYFKNVYCEITAKDIVVKPYSDLKNPIWENRIINKIFNIPKDGNVSQFRTFCKIISKNDEDRFKSLQSILGYLLHRNKSNSGKAIVLYDENMGLNGKANGGTGKTLLGQAIGKCRETESFDGKNLKIGSWFNNQRINLTTEILFYDDFTKEVSFEIFYPLITTGIEVEKKRQQAFFIPYGRSPKVLISSNYLVRGSGGTSEARRKFEFELANYFDDKHTPEDEFGNRFFDDWNHEHWNEFYYFMMESVKFYLANGLVEAEPINLDRATLIADTSSPFIEFAKHNVETDTWLDKREHLGLFKENYSQDISSNQFTRNLNAYADRLGYVYEDKSTGGDYKYIIHTKQQQNGAQLQ
jgi:hypothetical protein